MDNPRYLEHLEERLWIMAGDHRQFEYYSRLLKIQSLKYGIELRCIYLDEPRKLFGNRQGNFIRVGTWYNRRAEDLDELFEILNVLEFKEIKSEIVEREEQERREYYERREQEEILFHESVKPFKVPKNYKIWGQEELKPPPEFITAEEMTI